MTFARVAGTNVAAGGATGATTAAVDTTGAKLITVIVAYAGTVTVTDSKSNTYTQRLTRSSSPTVALYDCISPTVGTGHTFTVAGSGSVSSISVCAYSATNTPSFDKSDQGSNASSLNQISGGIGLTPTNANELIVTGAAFASPGWGGTLSAASGWTLESSHNYVGGTNFGCDLISQIQTTATTIAANTVTGAWTSGPLPTDTVTGAYTEVVGSSLTITTPNAFEVHQRGGATPGGTTGSIQITGTVSGATEDIEASFNGGAFQTIATAVPAGNYSGTLTSQTQGQGTLTVRKKVTTTASATVANIGIGDVYLVIGDSLGEGRGTNAQSYTNASLHAADFRQDNLWKDGNDPSDTGTSIGSHWPLLATLIMADQSVPAAFITTATGGTDCAGSNNTWAKPGADYTAMQTTVGNSTVIGVRAVLAQLGPNAIVNSNNPAIAQATYQTALTTLAGNLATDIVGSPKLHYDIPGQVTTGAPPNRTQAEDNIRGAEVGGWNAGGNVRNGPSLLGEAYTDGVHPQTNALLLEVAQRWWLCLKEWYYGGSVGSSRGPRLSSAMWNAARNQMTIAFDRALKTGLTFATTAWHVSDNGAAMTISSIVYHGTNPNAILINTSAAATGPLNTTTVTFGSGEDATGVVIPLSTDITLPTGGPIQIPAEPIFAAAVSEFDNIPPHLSAPTATATGTTAASGTVTTDEANGTLYSLVTQNATETLATVKATGQTQTVTTAGVLNVSFTGLLASTTYYAHYAQTDLAGNDSTVVNSSAFTTPTPYSAGASARIVILQSGQIAVIIP